MVVYLKYSTENGDRLAGRRTNVFGIQFFDGTEVVTVPNKLKKPSKVDFMNDETVDFIVNSDYGIYVIEDYFDGDTAKFIRKLFDKVDQKKILWSDMRSMNDSEGIMIDHVRIYNWSRVILPDEAMFKFRCPFDLKINHEKYSAEYEEAKERGLDMTDVGDYMPYFLGRIMSQCWQKRDSTETALYVSGDTIRDNVIHQYDRLEYEEKCCYYNENERVCLPHHNPHFSPISGLGRCGDCAIEAYIWELYKTKFDPEFDVTIEAKFLSDFLNTRQMLPLSDTTMHFPM